MECSDELHADTFSEYFDDEEEYDDNDGNADEEYTERKCEKEILYSEEEILSCDPDVLNTRSFTTSMKCPSCPHTFEQYCNAGTETKQSKERRMDNAVNKISMNAMQV